MAARIESASEAGEVFVSEETAKLLDEGSTVEVGTFEFNGIDGEAMLYRLLKADNFDSRVWLSGTHVQCSPHNPPRLLNILKSQADVTLPHACARCSQRNSNSCGFRLSKCYL